MHRPDQNRYNFISARVKYWAVPSQYVADLFYVILLLHRCCVSKRVWTCLVVLWVAEKSWIALFSVFVIIIIILFIIIIITTIFTNIIIIITIILLVIVIVQLWQLEEPLLLLGAERFAGVDIRVRVKGGGHVAQVYGEAFLIDMCTTWIYVVSCICLYVHPPYILILF